MAAKKAQTFLTAEDILASADRPLDVLDVPEWGGAVRLRPLSLDEYWKVEEASSLRGQVVPKERALQMLRASIVDEDGEPMFDEETIRALGSKSFVATERVFTRILEISDLNGGLVEEAARMFLEGEGSA